MSGHSKWSQIKRQKGVADARRGQIFTRLSREISVAAREGGGDPETNFRLRLAVQRARDNNMPQDNIERAIKRGLGETGETALTELSLEGYGPGGIAILLQGLTDNRNRTLSEVRSIFTRAGGGLSESGSVSWLFEAKGVITLEAGAGKAEEVALYAIDAGAGDVKVEDSLVEVYTDPRDLERVRKALEEKFNVSSAELSMIPKTTVTLDEKAALPALRLLERLEELEEVQHVFSNANFPNAVLQASRP